MSARQQLALPKIKKTDQNTVQAVSVDQLTPRQICDLGIASPSENGLAFHREDVEL